jgi:DNA-binding beta-propeller fold protein YncE
VASIALPAIDAGRALAGGSAYVNDGLAPTIAQFDIAAGGVLAPKTPATVSATAGSLFSIVASPDGKSVYTISGSTISQFSVGAGGRLTPKTPATVTAGSGLVSIAISPNGASAYAVDAIGKSIYQFNVGPDGALSPKTPSSIPSGSPLGMLPKAIAISPDGRSAYVTQNGNAVLQFDIGVGGLLTAKNPASVPGGPFDTNAPSNEFGITVTPDGSSVYVANREAGQVWQYDVGAGGGLLQKSSGPVAQSGPLAVAAAPDGRSVYVTSQGGSVFQYDVGAGGALSSKSPASIGAGAPMTNPTGIALTPDGRNAYIANCGDPACNGGAVFQYQIGPGGRLTPHSPSAISAGAGPEAVTVLPDQGPVARISTAPAPAGSPTQFDGSGSRDPDGTVARYSWDFGDGTHVASTAAKTTHVYSKPGKYLVRLTVTDDGGCSTRFVYTGQTALCNGGPGATIAESVVIRSAPRPSLTHVAQKNRRWREGRRLPSIARARAIPIGTVFSFVLNENARVTLTFTLARHHKAAGVLSLSGHAGHDRISFQGRLSRRRELLPGSYTLKIVASNLFGSRSMPHRLHFTIVR